MQLQSRRDIVFILLAGAFITNAILAELIGVKLFNFGPFSLSLGVIAWPVVFVTTDIINEYFGVEGVRRLTLVTMAMILYAFLIVFLAIQVPAASFSPVDDATYAKVFGQGLWIIVGSITAFATSQMLDVFVFWAFRNRTGGKMLWLRSTGSTVFSQLIDTFIVIGIAFWLPGKISFSEYMKISLSNYGFKFLVAVAMTPGIYLIHAGIDKFLGKEESHRLIEAAARASKKKG